MAKNGLLDQRFSAPKNEQIKHTSRRRRRARLAVPIVGVLLAVLLPATSASAEPDASEWYQIGDNLDGQNANEFYGTELAMNAAGDIIVIGTPDFDGAGGLIASGKVEVFGNTGAGWQLIGSAILGTADGDFVGGAVAVDDSGLTIAVSTPGYDKPAIVGPDIEDVGKVEVFDFDAGANDWVQRANAMEGDDDDGYFGEELAMSADGNALVIGAPETDKPDGSAAAGLVSVYDFAGAGWVQRGFNILGTNEDDLLGRSVAIDDAGDRIFVSAIGVDGVDAAGNPIDDVGSTTAYENDPGGGWNVVGTPIEGDTELDFSGVSIATSGSGDIVVVGEPAHDAPNGDLAVGRVRVFGLQGGNWQQIGSNLDGIEEHDYFGERVAINKAGNIILVAAFERDYDPRLGVGAVQAYSLVGGNSWNPLNADIRGENEFDFFGESIAMNAAGTRIAVGAPDKNSPGDVLPDTGGVQVFGRCSVGASIPAGGLTCIHQSLPNVAPHLPVAGGSFPCVGASPMTPFASPIFAWSNTGAPVVDYWVYAGSSIGAKDYFDSGNVGAANATFMTGLPTDGSTVHVRLYHRPAPNDPWQFVDYTYGACQPN